MPIDSNGSTLKVTTNVGGKTYEDESYREAFYNRNQQQETTPTYCVPLPDLSPVLAPVEETKEVIVDDKLQDAIDKDLSTKGIQKNTKTKTIR